MARVLAISSQVARGAIGLSAVVPVLQALGHEVTALPTILLSNHPGHARFAGERMAAALLERMVDALDANGWLAEIDAVITGYLPSPEHVAVAEMALARIRSRRARALFVCDPVLGDEPKGLYIAEEAARSIKERLVPLADVVKLNRFELGWLSGAVIEGTGEAAEEATRLGPEVVVVTALEKRGSRHIFNLLVESGQRPCACGVERMNDAPHGTGDAFGGLLLGHRLRGFGWTEALGQATAGIDAILRSSAGHNELAVTAVLPRLRVLKGLAALPLEDDNARDDGLDGTRG